MAEQVEKAYQKQHLFQNTKAKGECLWFWLGSWGAVKMRAVVGSGVGRAMEGREMMGRDYGTIRSVSRLGPYRFSADNPSGSRLRTGHYRTHQSTRRSQVGSLGAVSDKPLNVLVGYTSRNGNEGPVRLRDAQHERQNEGFLKSRRPSRITHHRSLASRARSCRD